jgi:hypothetical protein
MDYKNLPQKFHRKSIRNRRKSLTEPPENAHREPGFLDFSGRGSLGRGSEGFWVTGLMGLHRKSTGTAGNCPDLQ